MIWTRHCSQAENENPWHFLIHGERGIGKSSLMLLFQYLARGEITGIQSAEKYNFLTLPIEIDPVTTYESLVYKIGREAAREARKHEMVKSAAMGVWEFLSRWEVLGVKYDRDRNEPSEVIEDLCGMLASILGRLYFARRACRWRRGASGPSLQEPACEFDSSVSDASSETLVGNDGSPAEASAEEEVKRGVTASLTGAGKRKRPTWATKRC